MPTETEPQHCLSEETFASRRGENVVDRLREVDWNFAEADTGFLTHNLHPYPAKFIPQIPNSLIRLLSDPGDTVADIFCGSGTTLLEALRLNRHAVGIDANPLAILISKAKTSPLSNADFEQLSDHRRACSLILEEVGKRGQYSLPDGQPIQRPAWRPSPDVCEFWFEPYVVEELANLKLLIDGIQGCQAKTVAMVAFSAIVVRVSKQDSDTRYVRREKNIRPGDTTKRYVAQLKSMIPSLEEMTASIDDGLERRMLEANLLDAPESQTFDLVVTSPPYPNAYSYHLYHRTRLIWLGYDPERFKEIEIGSHRKYSAKGPKKATPETFSKEFETIFRWLRTKLRDGRYACFIIGDSTIRKETVDNTSLIAKAGASQGFREVARINRDIPLQRKAFNPKIGKIKAENILVLQRA